LVFCLFLFYHFGILFYSLFSLFLLFRCPHCSNCLLYLLNKFSIEKLPYFKSALQIFFTEQFDIVDLIIGQQNFIHLEDFLRLPQIFFDDIYNDEFLDKTRPFQILSLTGRFNVLNHFRQF
jgi:hypothetical protein